MLPDFLCRPILMIFGVLYPGYMSYKVLKSKRSTNYGIWLMYWITFSLFTSVETVTDIFIGPWLPFYNELKLLFLYMTYPTSNSSLTYVYKNIINPFYKQHEKTIDTQINNFKKGGLQTFMATGKKCAYVLFDLVLRGLLAYGIQVGPLQNFGMNMNTNNIMTTNAIGTTEPDGVINWEEYLNDTEDNCSSSSGSDIDSEPEELELSYSDMYGPTPVAINNKLTDDPPASNTRRRKKAN